MVWVENTKLKNCNVKWHTEQNLKNDNKNKGHFSARTWRNSAYSPLGLDCTHRSLYRYYDGWGVSSCVIFSDRDELRCVQTWVQTCLSYPIRKLSRPTPKIGSRDISCSHTYARGVYTCGCREWRGMPLPPMIGCRLWQFPSRIAQAGSNSCPNLPQLSPGNNCTFV